MVIEKITEIPYSIIILPYICGGMNKDSFNKKLGKNICEIRERKKISKRRLTINIGKDFATILRLEKGMLNPSYYFLLEIAKGLDVDISQLVKGIK